MQSKLIEWIDEKNTYIMERLHEMFESREEMDEEENEERKKMIAMKNTHPIYCNLLSYRNDYSSMSERTFSDPDEVLYCLRTYQAIIAEINVNDIFVASIENFCMFMGWTAKVYNQMLHHSPAPIKETMEMVEDYLIESQISAGQNGTLRANITKFRMQTAGVHGSGLVTQKEQNEEDRATKKLKSAEQLKKELQAMGSKKLDGR